MSLQRVSHFTSAALGSIAITHWQCSEGTITWMCGTALALNLKSKQLDIW